MVGENIQVLKLNAEKLGEEIKKIAKEVVENKATWIEVRKDEINKSEELKRELEYFSKSVLAELHRRVFERVLPRIIVDLEKVQPVDYYEESFNNDRNEEEVWITEVHEFHYNVQFDSEYYGNYVIIEKRFRDFWYLELFVLRKVITEDKIRYLVLREDLEYLAKEYTMRDLENLEKVKAIIK